METMTIIDPETGDVLVGELSRPTKQAIESERRHLQKLFSNKEKKDLVRKGNRKTRKSRDRNSLDKTPIPTQRHYPRFCS